MECTTSSKTFTVNSLVLASFAILKIHSFLFYQGIAAKTIETDLAGGVGLQPPWPNRSGVVTSAQASPPPPACCACRRSGVVGGHWVAWIHSSRFHRARGGLRRWWAHLDGSTPGTDRSRDRHVWSECTGCAAQQQPNVVCNPMSWKA